MSLWSPQGSLRAAKTCMHGNAAPPTVTEQNPKADNIAVIGLNLTEAGGFF